MVGLCATILFEFILKSNKHLRIRFYKHHLVICGLHIHHSTYGLVFIAIGIILYLKNNIADPLFYISLGIGIITQHTLSAKRLVFVEKWRP